MGRTNARERRAVCAALTEFGFVALGKAVAEFATPQRMVALGREPLRIDIMTSIDGVEFADAWPDALSAKLGTHRVRFLGRAALIMNKRAAGRTKDLLDVALLEEGSD